LAGAAGLGGARQGFTWQAVQGVARKDGVLHGQARFGGHGVAGHDAAWRGAARQGSARQGKAWRGLAGTGRQGVVRFGEA